MSKEFILSTLLFVSHWIRMRFVVKEIDKCYRNLSTYLWYIIERQYLVGRTYLFFCLSKETMQRHHKLVQLLIFYELFFTSQLYG